MERKLAGDFQQRKGLVTVAALLAAISVLANTAYGQRGAPPLKVMPLRGGVYWTSGGAGGNTGFIVLAWQSLWMVKVAHALLRAASRLFAELFDKYIQAVGGSARVAAVASFAAKGTYNGYDTEFENVPIEIYGKAPAQRATVIHFRSGDSITTYDGRAGWISEADKPVPMIELTGDQLEGARVDGALFFPTAIKQLRAKWEVGLAAIEDRQVYIAQGTGDSQGPIKLFFDKTSGLLVREVRYARVPVGRVPVQIDFEDYREIPGTGVKMPFRWTATWTDGRSKTTMTEVQANPQIEATRFAKPSAVSKSPARCCDSAR